MIIMSAQVLQPTGEGDFNKPLTILDDPHSTHGTAPGSVRRSRRRAEMEKSRNELLSLHNAVVVGTDGDSNASLHMSSSSNLIYDIPTKDSSPSERRISTRGSDMDFTSNHSTRSTRSVGSVRSVRSAGSLSGGRRRSRSKSSDGHRGRRSRSKSAERGRQNDSEHSSSSSRPKNFRRSRSLEASDRDRRSSSVSPTRSKRVVLVRSKSSSSLKGGEYGSSNSNAPNNSTPSRLGRKKTQEERKKKKVIVKKSFVRRGPDEEFQEESLHHEDLPKQVEVASHRSSRRQVDVMGSFEQYIDNIAKPGAPKYESGVGDNHRQKVHKALGVELPSFHLSGHLNSEIKPPSRKSLASSPVNVREVKKLLPSTANTTTTRGRAKTRDNNDDLIKPRSQRRDSSFSPSQLRKSLLSSDIRSAQHSSPDLSDSDMQKMRKSRSFCADLSGGEGGAPPKVTSRWDNGDNSKLDSAALVNPVDVPPNVSASTRRKRTGRSRSRDRGAPRSRSRSASREADKRGPAEKRGRQRGKKKDFVNNDLNASKEMEYSGHASKEIEYSENPSKEVEQLGNASNEAENSNEVENSGNSSSRDIAEHSEQPSSASSLESQLLRIDQSDESNSSRRDDLCIEGLSMANAQSVYIDDLIETEEEKRKYGQSKIVSDDRKEVAGDESVTPEFSTVNSVCDESLPSLDPNLLKRDNRKLAGGSKWIQGINDISEEDEENEEDDENRNSIAVDKRSSQLPNDSRKSESTVDGVLSSHFNKFRQTMANGIGGMSIGAGLFFNPSDQVSVVSVCSGSTCHSNLGKPLRALRRASLGGVKPANQLPTVNPKFVTWVEFALPAKADFGKGDLSDYVDVKNGVTATSYVQVHPVYEETDYEEDDAVSLGGVLTRLERAGAKPVSFAYRNNEKDKDDDISTSQRSQRSQRSSHSQRSQSRSVGGKTSSSKRSSTRGLSPKKDKRSSTRGLSPKKGNSGDNRSSSRRSSTMSSKSIKSSGSTKSGDTPQSNDSSEGTSVVTTETQDTGPTRNIRRSKSYLTRLQMKSEVDESKQRKKSVELSLDGLLKQFNDMGTVYRDKKNDDDRSVASDTPSRQPKVMKRKLRKSVAAVGISKSDHREMEKRRDDNNKDKDKDNNNLSRSLHGLVRRNSFGDTEAFLRKFKNGFF